MSFPKAKTKRFNEVETCAPPPGHYDPKTDGKVKGIVTEKSERFKEDKENAPGPMQYDTSYTSFTVTPRKNGKPQENLNDTKVCMKGKVPVADLAERYRKLSHEARKKDSEIKQLKTELESTKKRHENTAKEAEQSLLSLKAKERELECNNNSHSANISQLEKKLQSLQDSKDEAEKEKEGLRSELEEASAKVKKAVQESEKAKEEAETLSKVLSQKCNQIQESAESRMVDMVACQKTLQEYRECLQGEVDALKGTLRDMTDQQMQDNDFIRHLKGEVFALTDRALEEEAAKNEAQEQANTLKAEVSQLLKAESLLNENLKAMTTKYSALERDVDLMERQSQQQSERLHRELIANRKSLACSQRECQELGKMNTQLLQTLNKEQEQKEHLCQTVDQLEIKLDSMSSVINRQTLELEQMKNEIIMIEEDKSHLLAEIEGKLIEQEQSQSEQQIFQQVAKDVESQLREEKQVQEEIINAVKAEVVEMDKQLARNKADMRIKMEELETKLDEYEHQVQSLTVEKANLEDELEHAVSNVEKVEGDSTERMKTLMNQLDDEKVKGCDLECKVEVQEERITKLTQDLKKRNVEMGSLQNKIEQASTKISQLETDIVEMTAQKEACVTELNQKIVQMEIELDNSLGNESEWARKFEEIQALYAKEIERAAIAMEAVCEANVKIASLEENVFEKESAIERMCESHENTQEMVLQRLEQVQTTLDDVEDKNAELYTRIMEVTSDNAAKDAELKALEAKSEDEKTLANKEFETMKELKEQEEKEHCETKEKLQEMDTKQAELIVELGDLTMRSIKTQQELDKVIKVKESLSSQCSELKDQLEEAQAAIERTEKKLESEEDEILQLEAKCLQEKLNNDEQHEKITELQAQLRQTRVHLEFMQTRYQRQMEDAEQADQTLQTKIHTMQEQLNLVRKEYKGVMQDYKQQTEQNRELIETVKEQKAYIEDLEAQQNDLQEQQQTLSSDLLLKLESDGQKWKKLYQDLQRKVEPFQDQLDSFEAERLALLASHKDAQSEVDKLSREYARLLGHQNNKQKIHHVLKLKEENNNLRLEVQKMKETTQKQKLKVSRLEEKIRTIEGKKRFDSSKAFSHCQGQENAAPPSSPLRDGNRK